jgi:hypothetical protein
VQISEAFWSWLSVGTDTVRDLAVGTPTGREGARR